MESPSTSSQSRLRTLVAGDALQRILALGALVMLLLFFSLISAPFRTTENFTSILVATAVRQAPTSSIVGGSGGRDVQRHAWTKARAHRL